MDNIQLCYIDNEINKIDKMKQGDVIYKNGMELLVVLSYDHNEPCKGCFFYKNKACGSEKLIKCWDCKKEYIFTAIRKYNTTELCGIVKRYEETYKIILKTIKKIEKECQKYVIWDTVHVIRNQNGTISRLGLEGVVKHMLYPTPTMRDYQPSVSPTGLVQQNGGKTSRLNPLFVEEMMGYPLMWTTLPFLTENG